MKISALIAFMVTFTVIANLLLKQGAMAPVEQRFIFGLYGWKTLLGFSAFAIGAFAYAALMRYVPLNVAQSFAAVQFIAVILASAVVLSEPIPLVRWLGIVLIAAGVLLVGSTTSFDNLSEIQPKSGDVRNG